eukprot:symbB.v1.2.002637.t1/scaffold139.1/size300179/20
MKLVLAVCLTLAFQSDAASLRRSGRSKLTFIEEQMTMQMKLMMPEKATLNNIEASVLNMARAKKHGSGGTNLTGFLDQIQELLEKTMKKNILQRKEQTQFDLDGSWANLTTCTHPNDTTLVHTISELDEEHVKCRSVQDTMWSDYDATCIVARQIFENERKALCDAYEQAKVFPTPATTCVMNEGTPVPTIGHYLIDMEKYFSDAYDALFLKKQRCDIAMATPFPNEELCGHKICQYYDQEIECDKKQQAFELPACEGHKKYTCGHYTDCYAEKKDIYDSVVTLAQENEVANKAEWRAVLRIQCLLDALRVPDDELEAAIDACKGKTFSTTPVELKYHGAAASARSCTEVYLAPGSAVFSSTWYSGLSSATPAESCASSCCMAEEFNPQYPPTANCPYVHGAPSVAKSAATTTTASTTTTTTTTALVYVAGGRSFR